MAGLAVFSMGTYDDSYVSLDCVGNIMGNIDKVGSEYMNYITGIQKFMYLSQTYYFHRSVLLTTTPKEVAR